MDPFNRTVEEIERLMRAFRQRAAVRWPGLNIPRVFSGVNDDADLDDAPDAFVAARLRPRRPLGGSAIALPEPDEDATVAVVASRNEPS